MRFPAADHQHTTEEHGGVRHGNSRQTVRSGQGGASDYAKPEFSAYARQVDAALCKFLRQSREPLVLAAARNLVPLYRDVNHYAHLQGESIGGSPELQSTHELHRRAWDIVLPHFASREKHALAKCAEHAALNRGDGGLHEILIAAHEGRIGVLVISSTCQRWGSFDPSTGQSRLLEPHAPGAEDLLNLAVLETLRHGGDAYAADLAHFGIHELAAAVFKFSDIAMPSQSTKTSRTKAKPAV